MSLPEMHRRDPSNKPQVSSGTSLVSMSFGPQLIRIQCRQHPVLEGPTSCSEPHPGPTTARRRLKISRVGGLMLRYGKSEDGS